MALTAPQLAAIAGGGWFARIPIDRQRLLLSEATAVARPDGARIYATGDEPNGLWGVIEGRVRLLDYPQAGAEVLVRSLGPGEWFGELSTIDGGPRPQDAAASGPTVLAHVSTAALARLFQATPELYRDLALLACAHQRAALAFIGQRVVQSIRGRVAGALLDVAGQGAGQEAGQGAGRGPREGQGRAALIRQSEIAVIVGVSRQTLNRTLKAFEVEGVIRTGYRRVEVLDERRLRAACSPRPEVL